MFRTASVTVNNKAKLQESLELYLQCGHVEGEILDGDNKYMCEKAKKKVFSL